MSRYVLIMLSSSIFLLTSCAKEFQSWNLPVRPCSNSTTLRDIDDNRYDIVKIGEQCWMQSNLKVSRFKDGSSITNFTDNIQWSLANTGAWCNYNNDTGNGANYGKLYNWYAVNDSRGLCPTGWHVPSDAEWITLGNYLGTSAGGNLKSTTGWSSPNTGATNSSGFTALPGGYRDYGGGFYILGYYGSFWSSSVAGLGSAQSRYLSYDNSAVNRASDDQHNGFSVRCVRD
jgi:uncharacterized protein (TIGR02145 family)